MKIRIRPSLAIAGAIVLVLALPAAAALFRAIDGEGASISGGTLTDNGWTYSIHSNGAGVPPVLTTARCNASCPYSIRARIPPGPDDNVNDRSEVQVSQEIPITATRYLRFWVYIPNDYPNFTAGSGNRQLFFQLWQDGPYHPPMALYLKPGSNLSYEVTIKKDGEHNTSSASSVKYTDTLPKKTWVKFVVGWKGDPSGTNGWVKVWKNGSLRYTYTGKWGYTAAINPGDPPKQSLSARFGIYGSDNVTGVTQQMWFDDIKYGDTMQ